MFSLINRLIFQLFVAGIGNLPCPFARGIVLGTMLILQMSQTPAMRFQAAELQCGSHCVVV